MSDTTEPKVHEVVIDKPINIQLSKATRMLTITIAGITSYKKQIILSDNIIDNIKKNPDRFQIEILSVYQQHIKTSDVDISEEKQKEISFRLDRVINSFNKFVL